MASNLPRMRPGQTPTAADWNALRDEVERAGGVTGTVFGDTGSANGLGGAQVLDGREKGHWAKIGTRGTGATYAHTAVASDGDGTFTDLPADPQYEYGTTTVAPAREVNGDTAVASGTIAWVWPDTVGAGGYLFEAGGGEDCCGWGADYATALRVTGASGSVPANVVIPFSGSTAAGVVVETLLKIPADSGPVLLSGGLLLGWGVNAVEPVGANRTIVAEAGLTTTDSDGNGSTSPPSWMVRRPGLFGGWDANSTGGNAPLGRYGDQTLVGSGVAIAWPANGTARLARHLVAEYVLPTSASDRYVAWAVSGARAGSWGGLDYPLVVWAFGQGGTWLRYEKICCPDDPIVPPRLMSPPRGMDMATQSLRSVENSRHHIQAAIAAASGPATDPGGV